MKANMINSLKKAGLKQVNFDEYLGTTDTNMFAISDNKRLLYVNIDGKTYVISDNCKDNADYLAVEMKVNHISEMQEMANVSAFIATNNGVFFTARAKEIGLIYSDYMNDNYLICVVKK